MSGPNPTCPNCNMELTPYPDWEEGIGTIWRQRCKHCGWDSKEE